MKNLFSKLTERTSILLVEYWGRISENFKIQVVWKHIPCVFNLGWQKYQIVLKLIPLNHNLLLLTRWLYILVFVSRYIISGFAFRKYVKFLWKVTFRNPRRAIRFNIQNFHIQSFRIQIFRIQSSWIQNFPNPKFPNSKFSEFKVSEFKVSDVNSNFFEFKLFWIQNFTLAAKPCCTIDYLPTPWFGAAM